MSRSGPIHQVSVADGFADDCDELLHRCSKHVPLNFMAFSTIWKQMGLSDMYKERPSGAEIAELSEEAILIAKSYMLADTSNFEQTVAGVFLVYALLNLQPFPSFAWLRVVPDDVPAIIRIEQIARRQKRIDVLYILGSILINHSQYHAVAREHGLEVPLRKYIEGAVRTIDRQGIRPKGVIYRQNTELELIRELKSISKVYDDAKASLLKDIPQDRNLGYTDGQLAAHFDVSVKKVINGLVEEDSQLVNHTGQSSSKPDHHTLVQSIKQRAMQSTVEGVKHLTGVAERSATITSPVKTDIEVKKPRSKKRRKGQSATVPENTKAESKPAARLGRQVLLSIGGRPKKRKQVSSSSEEESDGDIVLESDEDAADDPDSQNEDSEPDTDKPEKVPDKNLVEAKVIKNLNIDSLPVFIQTEDQSRLIQIEIIDQTNNVNSFNGDMPVIVPSAEPNATVTSNELNKVSECSTSTQEQADKARPIVSETVKDDDLFKKPSVTRVLLKKPDKSLLKKPHLKSKFKRLGMLPVANFNEGK
uniref:Uncharacterized protein n=1 Tax=Pectinophora gossypiella TaxID=13191 RepID=A0A1E1WV78_PECGO